MRGQFAAALRASLLFLIAGYRRMVSPFLPPACRFHPTCSEYARDAVSMHGPAHGTWLAARRILRCHPGCAGGFDPVPVHERARRPFAREAR